MSLVICHLQLVVLLQLFRPMLVSRLRILRGAVLQVRGCEMRRSVRQSARRDRVLVVAEVVLSAKHAVVIVLVVHVMALMSVRLTLESLAQVHLALKGLVRRTAIEQAMVLPMVVVIVHRAVDVVRRRIRAGRAIRRGSIGVGLE